LSTGSVGFAVAAGAGFAVEVATAGLAVVAVLAPVEPVVPLAAVVVLDPVEPVVPLAPAV